MIHYIATNKITNNCRLLCYVRKNLWVSYSACQPVCVCVNFNVCKMAITEIADLSFRISTFMLHEFVLLIATMKYFV